MVNIFDLVPVELRVEITDRLPLHHINRINKKIPGFGIGKDPSYFVHRALVKFRLSREQYNLLYKKARYDLAIYSKYDIVEQNIANYSIALSKEPNLKLVIGPDKTTLEIPKYLDPGMNEYIPETEEGYYQPGYQPDDLTYASVYYLDLNGVDIYLSESIRGKFLEINDDLLLDFLSILHDSPNGTPEQKVEFATNLIDVIQKYDYEHDLDEILEDSGFNIRLKKLTGNSLV